MAFDKRRVLGGLIVLVVAPVVLFGGWVVAAKTLGVIGAVTPASAELQPRVEPFTVTVVTAGNGAPLCRRAGIARSGEWPRCEQADDELGTIATGAQLRVTAQRVRWVKYEETLWFRTSYQGQEGWVSQRDTDFAR